MLAKEDDIENDAVPPEQFNEITKSYKETLQELDIFPITHRLDRNMLLWGADGLFDRLYIPQIMQQESISDRTGPRIQVKRKKEPYRPKVFEKILDRSLQETAASLFNKLPSSIRDAARDKEIFKARVSAILRNIDVLNERGIALDSLKIGNQLINMQHTQSHSATSANNADEPANQYSQDIYSYPQLMRRRQSTRDIDDSAKNENNTNVLQYSQSIYSYSQFMERKKEKP